MCSLHLLATKWNKQTNEHKTVKWEKLQTLPYDRKNITEYLRKTYLLNSSIALHVFDQMKFNQLQGFPEMCQITSLGLILLICLLVKDRY